jgi:hypothetical protein
MISAQKVHVEESQADCDRMDRRLTGFVEDMLRNDTLCCEIAQKFD